MNRNGILTSMCFPTFTGFSARHLNMHREEVTLVMVSAYNDWHIDEWAGSYPDRFIPIAILPTWNPEAMCVEIRRVAAKGCRAVTMPELPHLEGLPSYHDGDYWAPVFRTLSELNVVMCLHIGTGFGAISMAPNAPIDNMIILATQVSAMCAQDLLWGPAMRNYPDLKFAFSEGGIGWIPFYLDRPHRHPRSPQASRGPVCPSRAPPTPPGHSYRPNQHQASSPIPPLWALTPTTLGRCGGGSR
jgi:predicted TIM-barrel fold metal-dependent hydrolase